MPGLLALHGISKRFGALKATDDVSFELNEGEALGILGPNGAGKTTLFNLISGDLQPDAGRVFFAGADITRLPPHRRCRAGIGRSYQIPHPFSGMTVFENLLVAAVFGGGRREADATVACADILDRTGLAKKANQLSGTLTLLDRKRLELARALATQPRVLLLDEIAGGLTEHEARELVATIRGVRDQGVAIVWIEHVVHALLACVSRLVVLNFGELIAEGDPREVMASSEVQRVYMGIEV
ncbi:MAG TPA: ABC transporter ATP-binding protein [Burkholderiales bacterium]|nr:ABC transporter ATP-binding protein [Burkholderiales bacterium]